METFLAFFACILPGGMAEPAGKLTCGAGQVGLVGCFIAVSNPALAEPIERIG